MSKPKPPRTIEEATALLERYSELGGELALIDAKRNAQIAAANAVADDCSLPVLTEQATIAAQLEPWWRKSGIKLLTGKRKSVVLGGCTIGSKLSSSSLTFAGGDDKAAMAALELHRRGWAKPYVRVSYAPDKPAIRTALDGRHADQLKELGFKVAAGVDQFFVEPIVQAGTVTGAKG